MFFSIRSSKMCRALVSLLDASRVPPPRTGTRNRGLLWLNEKFTPGVCAVRRALERTLCPSVVEKDVADQPCESAHTTEILWLFSSLPIVERLVLPLSFSFGPAMRHGTNYRRLGRKSAHLKALLRVQTAQLLQHERICTTVAKAKELRRPAEKVRRGPEKGEERKRPHASS